MSEKIARLNEEPVRSSVEETLNELMKKLGR